MFSTDPELVGKVTDVIGLYLAPPENAIVLSVDEKSQFLPFQNAQSSSALVGGGIPAASPAPMTARAIYVPLTIEAAFADQIAAIAQVQFTAGRLHLHGNFVGCAQRVARSPTSSGSPAEVAGSSLRLGFHWQPDRATLHLSAVVGS